MMVLRKLTWSLFNRRRRSSPLAELGPGVLLGERALLEGGRRTATITAVTACKAAVVPGDVVDRAALSELSAGHRREEATAG